MIDVYLQALAQADWLLVGLMFAGAMILAHTVGSSLGRALEVAPGHGREVMPSLPVAPTLKGQAAVRFHHAVLRVERLLVREFADGVHGAEATTLGGVLNEDPIVVSAALERLREEIPCRMRITASGRILHDFTADDIATLRRKRRAWMPARIGMFALAGLANIGAIWPVLLILTLAIWTLDVAVSNPTDTAVMLGGAGLLVIVVAFAVAMAVSWVMHFVLTPLGSAPKLGQPAERKQEAAEGSSTPSWWVWGSSGRSSSSRSSSSGGSSSDRGGGAAQAIIIIIAIAIIVLCTIALFVWARGVWRALSRDERALERVSPVVWVDSAVQVDTFERFIPTNDLVGRVYRALDRAHSRRRPVDEELGPRVLSLARRRRGRVSTLDIALAEALDLNEAAEVGSRLCGLVGGRILVSDEGDLVFEFPGQVLREIDAELGDAPWAEYVEPTIHASRVRRLGVQADEHVPVNMVGLTYSHLVATDRLVGGTWLMAVSVMLFLNYPGLLEFQLFAPLGDLFASAAAAATPITLLLFGFAIGATCLSAAARYTARAVAAHGVRRDVRRVTFEAIREATQRNPGFVDLTDIPSELTAVFKPAWRGISESMVRKEVHGVLVDLDLSPDLAAEGRLEVPLDALRRRLEAARSAADAIDDVVLESGRDDDVVFETSITHDRVKVLA